MYKKFPIPILRLFAATVAAIAFSAASRERRNGGNGRYVGLCQSDPLAAFPVEQ